MNNIYSFILGHSSKLSHAEILSYFKLKGFDFETLEVQDEFLICKIKNKFDPISAMKDLGGVIKIGQLEFQLSAINRIELFCETFSEYVKRNYNTDQKIKIGFSFYNASNSLISWSVKETMHIKRVLQDEGMKVRIISSKKKELSAVIVKKENLLLEKGFDMQILQSGEKIYCSKTMAIQDFEKFGILDYGRPRVDSKSGMMPPKLAQIMLNLSQSRENIYDPFCGSGTILLMASELGFKRLIGSDISPRAIADTKENMEWYEDTFNTQINYEVFEKDILNLSSYAFIKTPNVIVTEGYLGQPMHGNESLDFIKKQIKDLEVLYIKSFEAFENILESGSVVVMSIPVFVNATKLYYLDILEDVKDLGFTFSKLIDEKYLGKRQTLIYKRNDQKVYREIVRFVKD